MSADAVSQAGRVTPAGGTPPALDLRNITMRFGTFRALKNVDFQVRPGEIVALLGENGCGKSTLVKVLAGVNAPEPGGELYLSGRQVPLPLPPGQFRGLGLSFVHQDLGLARTLSVVENLMVGERGSANSRRPINWRAERNRVEALLESYRVHLDPTVPVNQLPPVGQALVAIVRAAEELKLYRERGDVTHSILFLDEPTVFLPEAEVEFLFDLVRTVVKDGASTVFISHDLSAVRALCDRAVVLRDGEVAGQARLGEVDDAALVELIVGPASGKTVGGTHRRPAGSALAGQPALCEVTDLRGGRVRGIDLALRSTEIVGVAGLLGSGAEDLPYLLFGERDCETGTLALGEKNIAVSSLRPFDAVRRGVALVPADRRRDAIVPTLTVAENTTILVNDRYTSFGRLRLGKLAKLVRSLLDRFDVRPRRPDATMGQLSGGNQQKVVLAKWLEIGPALLLLHEPTQGVDVAARAEIYRLVREAAEAEMATLWVSSDFEELATICDRVLIMADGVVRAELTGDEVTEDRISSAVYHYSTGAAAVLGGSEE
ncbi:sugar ABC transporter ATP-binding protein [Amycolatopsis alkalitolerans]|uniref:Sugar ABC transporter ATP-binding protein n=1 Tax=Amycolatopsis alkalitolerans TaxID=2547244 RepID=A0A5C4M1T5_9PSEU|nr:sugar ABC transporter ATP-binding protein [Amycolatopsis alkalitolerans]TNC26867.1 sugar ABC transporter ATP-binding protein [Amycolatopsis alkalitolerans]